jgi:hypothetical protein
MKKIARKDYWVFITFTYHLIELGLVLKQEILPLWVAYVTEDCVISRKLCLPSSEIITSGILRTVADSSVVLIWSVIHSVSS